MTAQTLQLKVYGSVASGRDATVAVQMAAGATVEDLTRRVYKDHDLKPADSKVRVFFMGQQLAAGDALEARVPDNGFVHCFVSPKQPAVALPQKEGAWISTQKRPRRKPVARRDLWEDVQVMGGYFASLIVLLLFWCCYVQTPQHFDVFAVASLTGFTTLWTCLVCGRVWSGILQVVADAPEHRLLR